MAEQRDEQVVDAILAGDAYLFVTPEYNHSVPAVPDGSPADDRAAAAAKIMLDDLAWWGTALQQARRDGPLPPAIMRAAAR